MKDECYSQTHLHDPCAAEVKQVPGWVKRLHKVTKTLAECHGMLDNVVGHAPTNDGEVHKEPSCHAEAMNQEFRDLEQYAEHLADRIGQFARLF